MDKKNIDFTQGNIIKNIVYFALPIIAGQLFQNLYNSVDSIVVGQFVGKDALAATSTCVHITNILVGFFTGLSIGNGAIFARYVGAKNYQKLHDSIHTAITFSFICGILMMICGNILAGPLLKLIDCPIEIYQSSKEYLSIYTISCGFLAIYNTSASILRSAGDSRTPFIYLVISSVCNVILDIFFVTIIKFGVKGVAIATVISQLISVILIVNRLLKVNSVYKVIIKDLRIDLTLLKEVIVISIPSALQYCIISIGNMFVQKYINSFGTEAIAGIGAALKADKFVTMPIEAFESALMTFVSQNYGAKLYSRIKKGIKKTCILMFVIVACVGVACYILSPYIISIFNSDSKVIEYGVLMMRTLIPFYPMLAAYHGLYGVIRGYGHTLAVMITAVFGLVVCRQIYLAIIMSIKPSVNAIVNGYPLCWAIAGISIVIYYFIAIRGKYDQGK